MITGEGISVSYQRQCLDPANGDGDQRQVTAPAHWDRKQRQKRQGSSRQKRSREGCTRSLQKGIVVHASRVHMLELISSLW